MAVDADPDAGRIGTSARGPDDGLKGKSRLFLRLFLQNERRLYAYVFTLLPNRADADDVFQDVTVVMWDKFDDRNPPADFTAWGCRIAYFKVLDRYKKNRRSKVTFSQTVVERLAETAMEQRAGLRLDERREALASCLEKLPSRDRALLTHRFAHGATVQSTSVAVGRSVEAIYKALAKVRQSLFDCVQRTIAREAHT